MVEKSAEYIRELEEKIKLLSSVIENKNKQLEHTHTLMTSLILDLKKWVIVLDIETGEELFVNNEAHFIKKSDYVFTEMLYKALLKSKCNKENTPVLWEYTYKDEIKPEKVNKLYYNVNSYYIPWNAGYAVAHIINDNTAVKRTEIEMHTMAYKDSLTDLYNRRYAMKTLEKWISDKINFCIAFIDIDYLKYCNDFYGHEEGNNYILLITEFLSKIPEEKLLCRIGGDEFIVIKRDISMDEMDLILDKIRNSLLEYKYNDEEVNYRRSYSYGSCTTDYSINLPLERILRIADQKMYQYKYANKLK